MPPTNEVVLIHDGKPGTPQQAPVQPSPVGTSPKPAKRSTPRGYNSNALVPVPGTVQELRGTGTAKGPPASVNTQPSAGDLTNDTDSSSQSHSTSNSPEVTPSASAAKQKGRSRKKVTRPRSRSAPSDGPPGDQKAPAKSPSEASFVTAESSSGKRSSRRRARSVSSAVSSWRPETESSHLFGKSWAARKAMPDANHASTTPRMRFQPLWTSDVSLDIPEDVSRTGRRRAHSAVPCFRSATPRLAVPHVSGELGPGSYTVPDNVTRTGCSLRRGELTRAAFANGRLKPGAFPVPTNVAVGPGTYDPTATDIAVLAKRQAALPSAAFRSTEPRCKSVHDHLKVTLSVPAPGTYFEESEVAKEAGKPSAVFRSRSARSSTPDRRAAAPLPGPGQYHVPMEYDTKPSHFGFGGTSARFPRLPIPTTPPPGAYDVVW
eukprot:EG_transcript_10817